MSRIQSSWLKSCSSAGRMNQRIRRLAQTAFLLTVLVPGAAYAQTAPVPAPKLDESLRASIDRGCTGTHSVIIRTQPGFRAGLRASLQAHGNVVSGEFPALESVAAEVSCADLQTLAGFSSTSAISVNAPVGAHSLDMAATVVAAQAEVGAAKAAVVAAKSVATVAEAAKRTAQAVAAKRGTTSQKTAASAALEAATIAAVSAQTTLLAAQNRLIAAQEAVTGASQAATAREHEGKAAQRLNRRLFATMPVRVESQSDAEFDNTVGEYGPSTNAFSGTNQLYAGDGSVGVAVIDSGIEPGTDFDSRITSFYDFTQGDIRATAPRDGYGHGTHVAGLIGSEFVGVAPTVRLLGLKVLDARGQGTTANVVRAIEFAIVNKDLLNIQVLNLSLGHPIYEPAVTDPLVQAVEHAVRQGLVVVVSAGNFGINPKTGLPGYAGIASPGNAPSAISVGAVRAFDTVSRDDDRVAPYSSRGPSWYDGFAKPDVLAPGDNLLSVAAGGSTLRLAQEQRGNVGDYMRLSGTSMAAGVATGVVALVLQANHGLTPNAVKAVLEYSTIPVKDDSGVPYDKLTQGAGSIEVAGAVTLARSINSAMPVGSPWLSTSITPSTTIGRIAYAWSQQVIWGNHVARGDSLLSKQRPAWNQAIIWGEGLYDFDDNIVWGNNFALNAHMVWGNSFDAGDNIVWGNNIVWGYSLALDDNIVWGNVLDIDDNIVWGNNLIWGNGLVGMSLDGDNIVWGNALGDPDNIVWGNLADDNIVWGNLYDDNIVWGNSLDDPDNIVWGNSLGADVWGSAIQAGNVMRWTGGVVGGKADKARARRTRMAVK
jgi:serine protease AprX